MRPAAPTRRGRSHQRFRRTVFTRPRTKADMGHGLCAIRFRCANLARFDALSWEGEAMARRSGSDTKLAKARRRKTVPLKRSNAPKAVRHRRRSVGDQEAEVVRLTRERDEVLEQLSATSEVLEVISSSPGGLQPVFRSADGTYLAFWRGQVVYENGRIKRFKTEGEAWEYLTRCDAAGKIIH
jgi:hypothetical protein